jgi:FtsP/CotA-like multicopper oxidase with cupredoxin domain
MQFGQLIAGWRRAVALLALLAPLPAQAVVDGVSGSQFNLVATTGYITAPDGGSILVWSFSPQGGTMQYPGPTMILDHGQQVTVSLTNQLPEPVSMVFPGMGPVTANGGTPGIVTNEAAPGQTVTYTFTANQPGTYLYHSGTNQDLHTEMGLVGAIVVRPSGFSAANRTAYGHPGTAYDYEYLFLLSEMDPAIHNAVERGVAPDMSRRFPLYWYINGRAAPDTMEEAGVPWLPHQPYNAMPRTRIGETILARVISAGLDAHPFHTHGNHAAMIARDGRMLESAPGAGPDLATVDFTLQAVPGETFDLLWNWTGKGLGWDIHGHQPGDPCAPNEDCSPTGDHGKPLPVEMPPNVQLTFGPFFSGSPFIGSQGQLPPGEGGYNANNGLFYMWHSHNEKELTNFDIFPGGMMTMVIVEPATVEIPR